MHSSYDLVWYAAERTPDHLAIVDDRSERRLSYRQLIDEVDAVAAGLAARGVTAGSRFATVLPNLLEHALILLALARLGAVPALVNARLTPDEVAELVREGGMQGAIVLPNADMAKAVAGALPNGTPLLCAGGEVEGAESFAACRGDGGGLPPFVRPGPEDLAYIFYTSGTTGLPKGVEIPHRTTEPRIVWISPMAGLRCGTHGRILGLAPLSHAIGFYGNFLAALTYNATYYVVSQFDPAKAVDAVAEHRITFLFTVPTFYAAMVGAANYDPAKMASLELVLYGGASISPSLLARIDGEWPATIRHIYGTTETMCSLYHPEPVGQATRLRPGRYSRVRVIRYGGGHDDRVAPGEEGELIVDGDTDTIFNGYLDRPDATAEKLREGWYFTGDAFRLLEDGDVEFIGRVDDVIRSGGENVHPDDVEPVLAGHPAIREVSVVGVEDAYWGERVVACVVAAKPAPTAAELDAHCKASPLTPYKRPRGYVFVDALPRNAANKVLRRVLRETAHAARQGEAGPAFHALD
ncbi:MAG: AMP-binding protein [Alphaproteobacteria bacterium]|jgi:2-furoate---CoA ligase|nr:AMP-binding protein [Alphaproteobacteria bacterium]MDP6566425.1 AMP-binding protein [Alphaproteobacteria bacterium]MDP6811617.1 AMP-binding protein [Alphaproteobacteria bacterium]